MGVCNVLRYKWPQAALVRRADWSADAGQVLLRRAGVVRAPTKRGHVFCSFTRRMKRGDVVRQHEDGVASNIARGEAGGCPPGGLPNNGQPAVCFKGWPAVPHLADGGWTQRAP